MIATNSEAADRKDGSTRFVDAAVAGGVHQLMNSIEERLHAARERLLKDEASAQASRRLCESLPAGLPLAPSRIRVDSTVYRADAELMFEVRDVAEACTLVDCLPPVSLTMVEGGCTAFVPTARYVARDGDKTRVVAGVVFRVERDCNTVYWWTELAGQLTHIVVKTPENAPGNTRAVLQSRKMRDAHTEEGVWVYDGLPAGKVIRWYSSQGAPELSVYQDPDMSFRQALANPQQYTARGVLRKCEC